MPHLLGRLLNSHQELLRRRNATSRTLHSLDNHSSHILASLDGLPSRSGIVILCHDPVTQINIVGSNAVSKAEHGAVIAAVEHNNLTLPRVATSGRQSMQVRLRTRVGEPHALETEPRTQEFREPCLLRVCASQVQADLVERRRYGVEDGLVGVAVETGAQLAGQIGVAVDV